MDHQVLWPPSPGAESPHFCLHELAEGVHAAVARPEGLAFSNAGIIDLGGRCLAFDTFDHPAAAADLRAAAKRLYGRSPDYVVISHWHGDHWSGNQVFPGAEILASRMAAARMPDLAAEVRGSRQDPSDLLEMVRQIEDRLGQETDRQRRTGLESQARRWRATIEALPHLEPTLPTLTFDGRMVLRGSRRSVELVAAGHRHSPGDLYLVIEEERIAFLGDLGFFGQQPFLADSRPAAWDETLAQVQQAGWKTLVPGHGPPGTVAELSLQRTYLAEMQARVREVIERGGTAEEALQIDLPEVCTAWLPSVLRFESNVRFLFEQLTHEAEG